MFRRKWPLRVPPLRPNYEELILGTPGLVAYYRFETLAAGFPVDSGPNGYDTDAFAGTGQAQTDGRVGRGFSFGALSTRMSADVGNLASLQGPILSLETWVRKSGTGLISGSVGYFGAALTQYSVRLIVDPSPATIDVELIVDSGSNTERSGAWTADSEWHHIAYTYNDSGNSVLYVDGAIVASGAASGGGLTFTLDPGRYILWETGDLDVDEVAFYNTELTLDQVRRRYNLGRLY